jgi:Tol biopolymer transport system component
VLDIWVMNADGSNKRQVTNLNKASFAPYFFPDAKRIIFSSNVADPKGRDFDLYVVNVDGSGLERITYYESFDGFPMFSPDGKKLVFASNRHNAKPNETNVFIADWVE